ncbi:hypothetical protein SCUCBS95973_007820 [Sporothrix curviconia]|uniref:Uncharacterized protein n=1 Tax=Sporothrix curviconia TaxID=1260050 RepID=A0ABP0CJB4_9PEZI
MDACNFPELLALDLETAESIFASRRMTAGAPRPMDVIFEPKSSKQMQDLYQQASPELAMGDMDLDLAQVNSILSKAAALAYASPPPPSPPVAAAPSAAQAAVVSSKRSPSSFKTFTDAEFEGEQSTTHAAVGSSGTGNNKGLDSSSPFSQHRLQQQQQQLLQQLQPFSSSRPYRTDPYEQPRPTTATGLSDRASCRFDDLFDNSRFSNDRYSPGPIFSISRTKTKPSTFSSTFSSTPASSQAAAAVPRYSGADTGAGSGSTAGDWDSDSVNSFELPTISLSRRDERGGGTAGRRGSAGAGVAGAGSGGAGGGRSGGLPQSRSAPSVHQRIQLQEEEQRQQLQQLHQLQQLQQLRQLQQELQEKQRLQQQLEQQLQLQFQREQALKEAAGLAVSYPSPSPSPSPIPSSNKKELVDKELPQLPVSDYKEAARKERPSHLPTQLYTDTYDDDDDDDVRRDSRDSYDSFYGTYNNKNHYDGNDNNSDDDDDNDAASVSSFGFNHPTAHRNSGGGMTISSAADVRGRQQSVVTMATSVTSSGAGCRFSSQSRTLSALGAPYASLRSAGAGGGIGSDRHVEFSLHDHADLVRDVDGDGDGYSVNISTKPTMAQGSDRDEPAAVLLSAGKAKDAAPADGSSSSPREVKAGNESSWIRFDDDDEEEQHQQHHHQQQTYNSTAKAMNGVSNAGNIRDVSNVVRHKQSVDDSAVDLPATSHESLPPRPKTSGGYSERSVPTDFRAMTDWATRAARRLSRVPAVSSPPPSPALPQQPQHQQPPQHHTVAVPQRRSSLGHQAALESFKQMQQNPKPGYVHRLRHFLSFSDASVYSNDAPRQASNTGGGGGLRSLFERPKTSSLSHAPPSPTVDLPVRTVNEAINANESIDEPLVFLQRTVYRKPVAGAQNSLPEMDTLADQSYEQPQRQQQQPARRVREMFSISHSHGDTGCREGAGQAGDAQERPFVEPLLVSQFDDDSDSEMGRDDVQEYDSAANNTRDADLFGDFEGAYNYEGDDKIMMATAMPFSKQNRPARSLHSVRSQRSQRSLSVYRLHESIPEHPTRYISGKKAVYESPDETTSHLQSWIEHASRSQQELALQQQQHQQQQQLYSQGPVTHMRSAFYDEEEPQEEVQRRPFDGEQDAVREQEVAVPAAVSAPHDALLSPAPTTYELQTALHKAQPVPLLFFSQPGIVGMPLPREVVDTLRVSVSCFPETMLSLSSFSIQTIRSYSRKVRHRSQADADDTYRLLMAPSSSSPSSTPFPPALPPSPTTASHHVPPSPASPTAMSFDLGTGVSRSMTATSTSTSHSSRRFWKKLTGGGGHNNSNSSNNNGSNSKSTSSDNSRSTGPTLSLFAGFRSSASSNGSSSYGASYPLSPATVGSSAPRMSSVSRRGSTRPDNAEEDQGKANGLCFKRIFPTGSDYLCDALYAHIIAFNYISLLCPPPPTAGEDAAVAVPEVAVDSSAASLDPTAEVRTLASSTTMFESAQQQQQQQRRQTIRIYAGSDVPLPLAEPDDVHTNASSANGNAFSRLLSLTSSRPSSRGTLGGGGGGGGGSGSVHTNDNNNNDDGRMISRKAALLLGITETLEPDSPSQSPKKASLTSSSTMESPPSPSSGGRSNSLARRYNSMRRRHHMRMGHSISESTAAASKMIKKALPGAGGGGSSGNSFSNGNGSNKAEISRPIYEDKDVALIPASGVPASVATTAAAPALASASAFAPTTAPTAPSAPTAAAAAAAAASDASMRDLHAGLHACISQLVATMKLTTGQLGNTLLNAEVARDIDPLFLRTLCELVRSQEEQF